MPRLILGVDPGTLNLGYGLLRADGNRRAALGWGVLRAPRGEDLVHRLGRLGAELQALIERQRPDELALEQAFAGKNVASALRIGEGRGMVIYLATRAGLIVRQCTPAQVKKAVTGNGRAHKEQVAAMVQRLLGLKETPAADAADALAIAWCCSQMRAAPPPAFARPGDGVD